MLNAEPDSRGLDPAIYLLRKILSSVMDARVKPAHDDVLVHTSGRDIQLMIGIAGSTQPMPATT
jgi:hypothetical protein